MKEFRKISHQVKSMNIILVGLMGSGKSTIGKVLAKHLGKKFVDSDIEIQNRTGVSIPHIFDIEGEVGFRERESVVIQETLDGSNTVLATGGGAVLKAANRKLMSERGIVIYLQADVSELWLRTRGDKNRPLLQTVNPQLKLKELFAERDPLYKEVADIVIQTGKQSVHSLILRLIGKIDEFIQGDKAESANMEILVPIKDRSYSIYIDQGLLGNLELLLPHIPKKRVSIVTNTTVAPLYLERVTRLLQASGVECEAIILPDGEKYKTFESINAIYDFLLKNRCERTTPIIALGGGVIGDMTGFAAATYLRGVPFIQIPTTLLSQVDSSVGGKTGINHPLGKNMIGAFYQPQIVLIDTSTLETLPDRELSAGLAEVIKYGLIRDLPFLKWIENNLDALLARNVEALKYAIARSCENKAAVVGVDERESGERAMLNLGHTFGHAIESGMGYGVWLHGEAVAAGTIMAADLSHRMGWISAEDVVRIRELFKRANLPIVAPNLGRDKYIDLMGMDKKVESGKLRFVLLKELGKAEITADVPLQYLYATLESCVDE